VRGHFVHDSERERSFHVQDYHPRRGAGGSIGHCRRRPYLKAFVAMDGFAGAWSLSTWLTRIVVNQALERKRTAQRRERLLRERSVTDIADHRERLMAASEATQSPEAEGQIAKLLERAVANLPETFRPVFVLREIEGLSVEETADILQIPKETVTTRLLRSRRRLQCELDPELRDALRGTFPFAGRDCDELTERVLAKFLAAPCHRPA
jgi:RNA polymerase sigma-70 factor, ECF subfamily